MAATSRASSRRQPGRPSAEQSPGARDALLDAASELFARKGVDGVSLRRLADEAGVTPAMVHYYFGSKQGLYQAMLARALTRVVDRVSAATNAGDELAQLLDVLFTTVAAEPWIPTLVVREVLSDRGQFRDQFVEGYASHMAMLVPSLIAKRTDAGTFRGDLDPVLSFLSLIGMSLMPFVGRPVIERVLGIDYDQDFVHRFADHTLRLFVEGARA